MKKENNYLLPLQKEFEKNANPEKAVWMEKYLKNQFSFFGLSSPQRIEVQKNFIKTYGMPDTEIIEDVIKECWKREQREYQYFAMTMYETYQKKKKYYNISLIEYMVLNKSWWDTVDLVASHIARDYFKINPGETETVTGMWNKSSNMWLQRTSLLFQLKYKTATNVKLLEDYILHLSGEKDFFIRKAIGWLLREYSKTDPEFVKDFTSKNKLSELSKKEALKVINRKAK